MFSGVVAAGVDFTAVEDRTNATCKLVNFCHQTVGWKQATYYRLSM